MARPGASGEILGQLSLQKLLAPESVALVGARSDGGHGARPFPLLREWSFPGSVYQVNPHHKTIHGERSWPSVLDLPEVADLALVMVNRGAVLGVLEECHEAGICAAVVIASDFADSAEQGGKDLQLELAELAAQTGMAIMGPNCLGFINVYGRIPAYCSLIGTQVLTGRLSIVSQSGGNVNASLRAAYERRIGLSYAISCGNNAALDTADYINYLVDDERTQVICAYVESVGEPERFAAAVTRAARAEKPVIAIKVGQSGAGKTAALAHTGSLAGPEEYISLLFAETGVIRADSIDEALDRALLFALAPRSRWPTKGTLAAVTVGGGAAGICADLAEKRGLTLPAPLPVSPAIRGAEQLRARAQNPLDIPGSLVGEYPELLRNIGLSCLNDDRYGSVVIIGEPSPTILSSLAAIDRDAQAVNKSLVFATTAGKAMPEEMRDVASDVTIPMIASIDRFVLAHATAVQHRHICPRNPFAPVRKPRVKAVELVERAPQVQAMSGERASALLALYGIPQVDQDWAGDIEEATRIAGRLGYPVAMKLAEFPHKSDVGGVRLGLNNEDEVIGAFEALSVVLSKAPEYAPRVVVQRMVDADVELHLGVTNSDASFPPMVVVAMGGVSVEVNPDAEARFAPVTQEVALEMLEGLRGYPLLGPFRQRPARDLSAVANAIVTISDLALELRDYIDHVDVNPLIVGAEGEGALAVDSLIVLRGSEMPPDSRII